jgi:hypothetical protein
MHQEDNINIEVLDMLGGVLVEVHKIMEEVDSDQQGLLDLARSGHNRHTTTIKT